MPKWKNVHIAGKLGRVFIEAETRGNEVNKCPFVVHLPDATQVYVSANNTQSNVLVFHKY